MEAAGLDPDGDAGKLDFHALRTTLCTMMANTGVNVRQAMEVMRHTDIRLTTKTYTDPKLIDTHAGVSSLPLVTTMSNSTITWPQVS